MNTETFVCKKHCNNSNAPVFIKTFCFIIFVLFFIVIIYNFQIVPKLIPFAKSKATTDITLAVQRSIRNTVKEEHMNFVSIKYGENNAVTSLEINSKSIAKINSVITEKLIEELCNQEKLTVSIPVGSILGGAIFSGKGPNINVKIAISPKITCNIKSEFKECGINQTLHRVVANLNITAFALLPFSSQEINISTDYCLAETVIIGKVPDAYTKINRLDDELQESDIDDIYDFGATLQ